jgi:hypothetical protein
VRQDPWETDEETIMQALCDAYNAGVSDMVLKSQSGLCLYHYRPMLLPRALDSRTGGPTTLGLC